MSIKRMHQTVGAPQMGRCAPPAGDAQRSTDTR